MSNTDTNPAAGGRKGAIMATTTKSAPRPGTARWLSAAGHPGYGRGFAAQVEAVMVRLGEDTADLRSVSTYAFRVLGGYDR